MSQLEEDRQLLEEIDNHSSDCNPYEADRVERLLKWVRGSRLIPGRPLRDYDRTWAEDLLNQLDER